MAIKNYRTRVNFQQTCGEITGMLAGKGARRIQIDYDESQRPTSISFVFPVCNCPVYFRLPCNVEGVRSVLQKQSRGGSSLEHARDVAWRILKDWVAAQVAMVEAGAAQMTEVFLPYAVHGDSGRTMFALFEESYAAKALTPGTPIPDEVMA